MKPFCKNGVSFSKTTNCGCKCFFNFFKKFGEYEIVFKGGLRKLARTNLHRLFLRTKQYNGGVNGKI